MLELNQYSIRKIEDLKDFITVTYVIIDDIYHEVTPTYIKERENINKVLAKSLCGLVTRLRTKILAHNLCYCINTILGKDINLGSIKELVFG